MIISIDAEKTSHKIDHILKKKTTCSKLEIESNILHLIKGVYKKPKIKLKLLIISSKSTLLPVFPISIN